MNFNRRTIMGLLPSVPFVGRRLAGDLVKGAADLRPPGGVLSGAGDQAGTVPEQAIRQNLQLMPRWRAWRQMLDNPTMREAVESYAWEQHRRVSHIDPDIEVYRSFSPMAKIAFQRQRNVEQMMQGLTAEPKETVWNATVEKINKLMWG
jgi:hypothetical protein